MLANNAIFRRLSLALLALGCTLTTSLLLQAGAAEPDPPATNEAVKELFQIEAKGLLQIVGLAPDGKTLAYCDMVFHGEGKPIDTDLILIDLTTGKEQQRKQVDYASGGVFSPDEKLLAFGARDSAVTVWDIARWEPKVQLKRPNGHVFGHPLAFSPDGKFVVGSVQQDMRNLSEEETRRHGVRIIEDLVVWDLATGDCRVLEANGALFMSDIFVMSSGLNRIGPPAKEFQLTGPYVANGAMAILFPADGAKDQIFVDYGRFITAWDIAKGKPLRTEWAGGGQRFRTTPTGRILVLPTYDDAPIYALPKPDGTIAVAMGPAAGDKYVEDQYGGVFRTRDSKSGELCRLDAFKGSTSVTCRLTADGKRLVGVGAIQDNPHPDNPRMVLRVWDVSGLLPEASKKMTRLTGAEREKLWASMFQTFPDASGGTFWNNSNGPRSSVLIDYFAAWSLAGQPDDAVPWLREKLGQPPDLKKIPQLIEDLESSNFKARQDASKELERIGHPARSYLERALAKDPPPETKRRATRLLENLQEGAAAYESRQLRIIDLLEHINTPPARALLKQFADGNYDPSFAAEAKQALRRVAEKR